MKEEVFGSDKLAIDLMVSPTTGVLPPPLTEASKVQGESNSPLVLQTMKFIFLGNCFVNVL